VDDNGVTRRWIAALAALALPLGLIAAAPGVASARQVTPEIVNGEPGVAGEFPFLASVRAYVGNSYYSCGGAFVSSTQVVTAAHCFFDDKGNRLYDVRVGVANGTSLPTSRVDASTVEVHAAYDPDTQVNDIALITLSQAITGASVVAVPTPAEWQALAQGGDAVRSAGWGTTSSGGDGVSNFLVADLTVVPDSKCSDYYSSYTVGTVVYRGLGSAFDPGYMLCAGGATTYGEPVDTCQGDSGGPLIGGTGVAQRLVGIVSWGYGCAGVDEGKSIRLTPGVYTRLGTYLDWLAQRGVGPGETVTVPGAPTGVTVSRVSNTEVDLNWTAPSDDGGATITAYEIELNRDGEGWVSLGPTDTAAASIGIYDMTEGSTYQFRVAAINDVGMSAFSQPSAPITMGVVLTAPGKVSGFTKSKFTKTGTTYKVTVRWKAPLEDGGSDVTGYAVRVGLAGTWSPWADLDEPASLLTKLKPGKAYTFQVRAVNAVGLGTVTPYKVTTPAR
jgi:trypsin